MGPTYTIFSVLCAWSFGAHTKEIVLLNLDLNNDWMLLIVSTFAFSTLLNYQIESFPVYKILESMKKIRNIISKGESAGYFETEMRRALLKIILLVCYLFISIIVPSLPILVGFIGSVFLCFLSLIMPV